MSEFIKMDIFFFVTTLAVVAITVLTGYVLLRLAHVLGYVEYILKQVATESDSVREDLAKLRSGVRQGKDWVKSLLGFFNRKAKQIHKKT